MKIIVDSNIVFSALLKTQTAFGQLLFNSDKIFDFYSARFLRIEIRKHWHKLKRISKLNDQQLEESFFAILTKITLINEELIPQKVWEDAERITKDIDADDINFVALTKYLKGKLWTGDKLLKNGLQKKGFKNVLTTEEIHKLWTKKRK